MEKERQTVISSRNDRTTGCLFFFRKTKGENRRPGQKRYALHKFYNKKYLNNKHKIIYLHTNKFMLIFDKTI